MSRAGLLPLQFPGRMYTLVSGSQAWGQNLDGALLLGLEFILCKGFHHTPISPMQCAAAQMLSLLQQALMVCVSQGTCLSHLSHPLPASSYSSQSLVIIQLPVESDEIASLHPDVGDMRLLPLFPGRSGQRLSTVLIFQRSASLAPSVFSVIFLVSSPLIFHLSMLSSLLIGFPLSSFSSSSCFLKVELSSLI